MIRNVIIASLVLLGCLGGGVAHAQQRYPGPDIGGDPAVLIPQMQVMEVMCRVEPAQQQCEGYSRWKELAFNATAFRPFAVDALEKLAGMRPAAAKEPEQFGPMLALMASSPPAEVAPYRVAALERLAQHYRMLGRFGDAIAVLERAGTMRAQGAKLPGFVGNLTDRGRAYTEMGEFAKAQATFKQARDLPEIGATDRYDIEEATARLWLAAGRPAEAERVMVAALARYAPTPGADRVRLVLGRAFRYGMLPALYREQEVHAQSGELATQVADPTIFASIRLYEQVQAMALFMEAYASATAGVTAATERAYQQMAGMIDTMVRVTDRIDGELAAQGFNPDRLVQSRGYAGTAYLALGKPEQALTQCVKAEAGLKALARDKSPDFVRARICKAKALRFLERWDEYGDEIIALLGMVPSTVGYSDPLGMEIMQMQTIYALETAYGMRGEDREAYLGYSVTNAGRMEKGVRDYVGDLPAEQQQAALKRNRDKFLLTVHAFWMGANGFPTPAAR